MKKLSALLLAFTFLLALFVPAASAQSAVIVDLRTQERVDLYQRTAIMKKPRLPLFGETSVFCNCSVFRVIPSQCTHWRGNPFSQRSASKLTYFNALRQ